jgi:hypothetical protein
VSGSKSVSVRVVAWTVVDMGVASVVARAVRVTARSME